MKRIISMLVCCLVFAGVQAQKITREYNNVSLSEALRQLNEQTEDYTISFLYNELEDFRITTSIHRKSVPDAIRQMIGFYPIRMTVDDKEIIVECPQKTAPRYKGTIIDEQGQPIAYANIALLSPQDSTLITGGVSNESGLFVIPCEQKPVLARISFVGYKTIYKRCETSDIGIIRMQPDTYTLGNVTVKGEIPQYKMTTGGMTVDIQNSMLKDVGTADDVLSMLPGVQGSEGNFTVFAKGTPEIYINNKKVQSAKELKQLKTELAALDRKIQLELAPPTPEVAEKENEGQQVKPEAEDVRNRQAQYSENAPPQIRNPSESIIANHTITGHPGLYAKEETRSKGLKI